MDNQELKKLLPQVIVENLSEEKLSKLGEEFNRLVEAKVDERTQVAVKCAETAFNEEANAKLQKLVCQIDEAHKKAFMECFDATCDAYEKEISRIKRNYNTKIKEESISFQKSLLEKVSNFIDSKIDKALPTSMVRKACRNEAALDTINALKKVLNVNEASAMDSIRKEMMEGVNTINKQVKEKKELLEQNAQLKAKLEKAEASQYLIESTASLPTECKNFVRRVLKDSDTQYIKENLNHVIAIHNKNVESNRNALLEKTLAKRYSDKTKRASNNLSRKTLVESTAQAAAPTVVDPDRANINAIIAQCKAM